MPNPDSAKRETQPDDNPVAFIYIITKHMYGMLAIQWLMAFQSRSLHSQKNNGQKEPPLS